LIPERVLCLSSQEGKIKALTKSERTSSLILLATTKEKPHTKKHHSPTNFPFTWLIFFQTCAKGLATFKPEAMIRVSTRLALPIVVSVVAQWEKPGMAASSVLDQEQVRHHILTICYLG
jgi:hypothetical protein